MTRSTSGEVEEFCNAWPGDHPTLFRFSPSMTFAIPPQYQRFWLQKDRVVHSPTDPRGIPTVEQIGFQFFLPDFSGYTFQNYKPDYHPDRVDVIAIEPADMSQTDPNRPGYYTPNVFHRVVGPSLDPRKVEYHYGLECYPDLNVPSPPRNLTCFSRRPDGAFDDMVLDVVTAPLDDFIKFPIMQARYFTKRYGGLLVVWRTHRQNFAHWRQIDDQIWKFVAEWLAAGNSVSKQKK